MVKIVLKVYTHTCNSLATSGTFHRARRCGHSKSFIFGGLAVAAERFVAFDSEGTFRDLFRALATDEAIFVPFPSERG